MKPALSLTTDKASLRRQFQKRRREFATSADRLAAEIAISAHLHKLLSDLLPSQICAYQPLLTEANFKLTGDSYYPKIEGDELNFYRPVDPDRFVRGPLQIREPIVEGALPLNPSQSFAVLSPALALDAQGNRLGLGKGYYDRFFSKYPNAIRIGVIFHVQFSTDPLPAESWDRPVNWIVTEKMILHTLK